MGVLRLDLGDLHRVLDAADELPVGRKRLAEMQLASVFVEGREIREGAADVDGDPKPSCAVARSF